MQKTIMLFLILYLSSVVSVWAGSIIIIANKDVSLSSLTGDELQRIFLGKKTTWNNGKKIVPVCLKSGKSHESFIRNYMDMNASQFDIFWKQVVFIGTGRPPRSFVDEAYVVQFVMSTKGGIGYIDSDTRHGMVKTLAVK